MNEKLLEKLKEKLEKEKKLIQEELKRFAIKDDLPKGDWETLYPNRENGSTEEEADEVQEYSNLLPIEHSLEVKLRNIELALEKIKRGKYGLCEKCGKKISRQRLLACPEASTCLKCEKNNN